MRLLLAARLPPLQRRAFSTPLDYDLLVIGGGSAGLACSKTASSLGARVALIDAVSPTPSGTSWGIGGTCANVGCIPKKLMHQAALVGAELKTAGAYGWQGVEEKVHCEWPVLRKVVQDRIKANNWIYRVQLNQKGIKYYNAFAEFVDGRTVKTTGVDRKHTEHLLSAPSIVVATGLRPRYPTIPGAHLGITSDDFFSLKDAPGKTLFVGGGYVSLECAGVLSGLGGQATAAVRSHWLRGFDRDCVSRVVSQMESHGVDLLEGAEPLCVEQTEQGRKRVTLSVKGEERVEEYDTVVWAIGREPRLSPLHLDTAGVSVSIDSGKILVDDSDATTAHGIYALGDVAEGRPELTPSAILAGQLLAKRLFGGADRNMDYKHIATTIFTPLEFSTLGLCEEAAEREYGEEGIEVYHSFFTPFEYVVPQNPDGQHCYSKVVCERDSGRVLGMHIVGPSAAEIIQGYAVAFKLGITFSDLSHTVAVHPCSSEEFVRVSVTKRSGDDPRPTGCCG